LYADWKSQIAYSSPNWNGFDFTAGVTQAWNASNSTGRGGATPAFEAKAAYSWAGDFGGKVWVSGITQKVKNIGAIAGSAGGFAFDPVTGTIVPVAPVAAVAGNSDRANAWDIGATVNVAGFGLTGYYGQGEGIGTTVQLNQGFDGTGNARDSDDWYVQGTYTIPGVGTKLGVSYGESTLDGNKVDTFKDSTNRMWTIGAYHPITKHLNLVAEYSDVKGERDNKGAPDLSGKDKTLALGAILFF
jgi:predicted porin